MKRTSLAPPWLGRLAAAFLGMWATVGSVQAQGTYVNSGGESVISGSHDFLASGLTGTYRNTPLGVFSFGTAGVYTNSSDAGHVDGYVRKYFSGATTFTLPTGDNGKLRPVTFVYSGAATDSVTGAYFGVSPASGVTSVPFAGGNFAAAPTGAPFSLTSRATNVTQVSSVEYWDLDGATAVVPVLSWDSTSNVAGLTGGSYTPSRLTIVGWNGTQWVAIASSVDGGSTATTGTMRATTALIPNTYTAYTLGSANAFAPVITSSGGGATGTVNVAENTTAVITVTATDADGSTLTYSIVGGADAAKFSINATTGALAFLSPPNYEAPTDAGTNNVYDVTVQVADGVFTDTQALAVNVTDVAEADYDGDGIPNGIDPDIDGDGILNIFDPDTDGDGIPNTTDTDDDNDGILDGSDPSPTGPGTTTDFDGDGVLNTTDPDIDGDGIANIYDPDTDGDGIPNTTDTDDDNDGILDGSDPSPTGPGTVFDIDGDGILNAADPDIDGDGTANLYDPDTDGDGIPNTTDTDDDNDGTLDGSDSSPTGLGTTTDIDGDGIANTADTDIDGDGIPNSTDPDADGDGIPNTTDPDDDNDGILDGSDATPRGPTIDTDGDGVADVGDLDSDNDGILDTVEGAGDTDGDGIFNYLDLDSDNDGINDVREALGTDANGDGKADGTANPATGIPSSAGSGLTPVDTDGDSVPDYRDLDSDNDTISDLVESGDSAAIAGDTNDNGIFDVSDTGVADADNDGIASFVDGNDNVRGDAGDTPPVNTDGTDLPDYRDADSDNDGTKDIVDAGNGALDGNGDGKVDDATDTDGDGIPNAVDNSSGPGGESAPDAVPAVVQNFGGSDDGTTASVFADFTGTLASVQLQGITNLLNSPAGWSVVDSVTPAITTNVDGSSRISWANINTAYPLFSGQTYGFVRAKLTFASGTILTTKVFGYKAHTFLTAKQTYSMPFLQNSLFNGAVLNGNTTTLNVGQNMTYVSGRQYYVEVESGSSAGHRFEVNESTTSNVVIESGNALNTLSSVPDLTGATITVRPHWTMDEVFEKTKFKGTTNATGSDQVQVYDTTSAATVTYFMRVTAAGARKWVRLGDGALADQGARLMPSGEGYYVETRVANGAVTDLSSGLVRDHAFVRPEKLGINFMGTGYPVAMSPTQLGVLATDGYTANTAAANADRLEIWLGDSALGSTSTTGYFLRGTAANPAVAKWVLTSDGTLASQNAALLFQPHRAATFNLKAAHLNHVIARPWTP